MGSGYAGGAELVLLEAVIMVRDERIGNTPGMRRQIGRRNTPDRVEYDKPQV